MKKLGVIVLVVLLVSVLIITLLIIGKNMTNKAPSSFFSGMDIDQNKQISYVEWMSAYSREQHQHTVNQCSRKDFYIADCDLDDNLTWQEYYQYRFKGKECMSPAVISIRQKLVSQPVSIGDQRANFNKVNDQHTERLTKREAELKQKYGIHQ